MKLSVFVVTYNQEKFIRECLNGILMQEVDFEYEVIIGDDCSIDRTSSICDEFAEKYPFIQVYHHKRNKGLLGNWEFVMNKCQGEYIALLEGDDYWIDAKKLQRQVSWMDEHPEFTLTFTRARIQYENGASPGAETQLMSLKEREYNIKEICSSIVSLSSSVVMRNCIKPVHYCNQLLYADTYTFIELLQKGKGYGFDIPTVVYRVHKDNLSYKGDFNFFMRSYNQCLFFIKKYPHLRCTYIEEAEKNLSHLLFDKNRSLKYRIKWMLLHPRLLFSKFLLTTIWRYWLKC